MRLAAPKAPRTNDGALIAAYARRLHARAGDRHHIVSPLGAWLLAALAAPLATGADRDELERVLGCDAHTARQAAGELLESPHPALALAFAAWHRGDIGAALDEWRHSLPACAASGPMPTQAVADAWAREQTRGQIPSIPIEIDGELRLLLASAVATEIIWDRAFHLVPSSELGGPWRTRVKRVMRRHAEGPVEVVARTEAAGLVGVFRERGRTSDTGPTSRPGALEIVSVIAGPEIPPESVIAAAYDVAAGLAGLPSTSEFVPAFDLPLTGHSWIVREEEVERRDSRERIEQSEVTIPAWSAQTELRDLTDAAGTGFPEIARAILVHLPPDPRGDVATAAQVATARFDTNGFSAAALTYFIACGAALGPPPRRTLLRTVELRFDRPFAMVATDTEEFSRTGTDRWRGLPAFAAWVAEPVEPSEPNETEFW